MRTRCLTVPLLTGMFLAGPLWAQADETPATPPRPCTQSDAYDAFDFWLGRWEVFVGDGRKAGDNEITKIDGDCLLQEKWLSVAGGAGTSLNFYDPGADEWVQHWVGAGGTFITIRGGLRDGSMVLEGQITYASNGVTNAFRGTWTPLEDGSVRQYFQESTDDGVTWQDWFEGFYRRPTEGQ